MHDLDLPNGFKEFKDVRNVPKVVEVVGGARTTQVLHIDEDEAKDVSQSIFMELMSASKVTISQVISKIITRLNAKRELYKNYVSLAFTIIVIRVILTIGMLYFVISLDASFF